MTDALGWRAKIGLIAPSTNTSVQPESEALRPLGVTNHMARITIKERPLNSDQAFIEHTEAMRSGIGAAIDQVMTCGAHFLVMGVALEAFWGGVDQSEALRQELEARAGVGVTMGSDATRAALDAFGAKRIAVLTPHQPKGDEVVHKWLVEAGYDVVRLKSLKCLSPLAIAEVTAQEIRAAYLELDGDDIDAVLQVGTNLIGMTVAAEAERWLNKPVLSMNMMTYWRALRRLGIEDKVHGFGRLLEEF